MDYRITAQYARVNFGKLLGFVEDEGRSFVVEKQGTPRAVLLSINDYVRLAILRRSTFQSQCVEIGSSHSVLLHKR